MGKRSPYQISLNHEATRFGFNIALSIIILRDVSAAMMRPSVKYLPEQYDKRSI